MRLKDKLPVVCTEAKGWPWTEETDPAIYAGRNDWPQISIVTPSFNQAQFLEETIRSVLLQNYPNLQYIVMDGGSTDGSVEIIKKYAPWLDHWESEKDRGQSHAINKGLERCNGEWFNWINSDDYLLPGSFHALMEREKLQDCMVVSGRTINVGLAQGESNYVARLASDWPGAMFSLNVNQPGALLKLAEVRACGGVREDLRLVMDLSLWLRVMWRCGPEKFAVNNKKVAAYRYHTSSKTCSGEDVFALEEFGVLTDWLVTQGSWNPPSSVGDIRKACGFPFEASMGSPWRKTDPNAMRRAWLQRMLIQDSLLYRAFRKANPAKKHIQKFVCVLYELKSTVEAEFPGRFPEIFRTALLRAMQIERRFDPATAWGILRAGAGFREWRELARLALRL